MIIAEKIEKGYKNQIKTIKNEKNRITKMKMIGSLAMDIGDGCISAVSRELSCSRQFVKECFDFVENGCEKQLSLEFRGRKRLVHKYPTLKKDIEKIVENHLSTDPRFKKEEQYVNLSIKTIWIYVKFLDTFLWTNC